MKQKDEKYYLLKYLLKRIHHNETTLQEKNVIATLKSCYDPAKDNQILTEKELKKAIIRNRKQIKKKIRKTSFQNVKKTHPLRFISLFIGSSAAAIALLLIFLTSPFTKNQSNFNVSQGSTGIYTIDKQFTTGKEMKKILLTDGSIVFLNQRTTITLRQGRFNAHIREIWLDEGEAFFNVEKKGNRPFIVHTPNGISTQVLGTSFNIRAYAKLGEQIISVNTGRVQVSDEKENTIVLDPNFKVSIQKGKDEFKTDKTNSGNIAAWRSGTIVFEEANIKEVAFRLEQAFGIELLFNNVVNENEKIVTSFALDTPQEEIISTICKLFDVRYKRYNNTVELIK